MPKDKTLSHIRVRAAIKEEFLEKGFEGASIRSIGAKAGMTSAGLYRHFKDKEAMFSAIVDPLIEEINGWIGRHVSLKYKLADEKEKNEAMFGESFADMIYEVILPRKEEFRMLLCSAKGTKYESFVHDFVKENQNEIAKAIRYLKKQGYPVKEIDRDELHLILSAYITACFEPIIHNYPDEKIRKYMKTIQQFFLPGWMNIMGLN